MTSDFKCGKCRYVLEGQYYPSFNQTPKVIDCPKCGGLMKRQFGTPHIRGYGVIPGYEKENQDKITLGKAIDQRTNAWV